MRVSARDRLRGQYRIAYRGRDASLVGDIDVDQPAGGGGNNILCLRHRAGQPRPVHLDEQQLPFYPEGEAATIAHFTKAAGVDSRGDVLEPETTCDISVRRQGHSLTVPSIPAPGIRNDP